METIINANGDKLSAPLDGVIGYKPEKGNDPGQYDGHLKPFGADINTKVTMGNKYKFVPKEGPAPGQYNADRAESITKTKNRAAIIREDIVPVKRQADPTPDPGRYDAHLTPFGADIHTKVNFGEKYKFVPKEGPAPGEYNVADSQTKPKTRFATIKEDVSPYRRPKEVSPDPGQYDAHLTAFGADINTKVTMGNKYKFVPKEGPAPGEYDADRADTITKNKTRSATIKEDVMPYRRPKDVSPDPGQYDAHLTAFGADINTKVTMGNKYKFVPKEGPAPGQYDADRANSVTKAKSRVAAITNEPRNTSQFMDGVNRYGAEQANDPGQYDGHLKPFGADINTKVTMGNKYKFVPKEGPAPGQYNADAADSQTKPKTRYATIKEDVSPYRRPKEQSPDPGQYDAHLTPFAADINTNVTMGNKYKFVPKEGPSPGEYNADRADSVTKSRTKSALIKEDVSPYRRPKEVTPDAGQYDNHLIPFGADIKTKVTMGNKYKFVPKEGPSPGEYENSVSQKI